MARPPLRKIFVLSLLGLLFLIMGSYYLFEWDRSVQIREAIVEREGVLREKQRSVRDHREQVAFYETQEGIEHLARERYNLVASGERTILLKSEDVFMDVP